MLLPLFLQLTAFSQSNFEECTIGVATGSATQDGRPLVWKTRDTDVTNNEAKFITAFTYNYVCVANAGSSSIPWMGLNEHGLAILNSMIYDLPSSGSGPGNGTVMRYTLGNCVTIDDFQYYLDSTNITGRTTTANFAVMDSTGAVAIFETGGNDYVKFDGAASPNGYIVRTNFSITGGGNAGIQRYNRSSALISDFHSGDSLNHKSILRYQMRDFSDASSQPYPVPYPYQVHPSIPYGYFNTNLSICRDMSVSTVVIQGILSDEKPELSVMWTMLGHPAAAIAVPYWPVGETPIYSNGIPTAALCNIAKDIREVLFECADWPEYINSFRLRDGEAGGLWECTFPEEDLILESAETLLNEWRNLDSIPVTEMLAAEDDFAETAYYSLVSCYDILVGSKQFRGNDEFKLYPNPVDDYLKISIAQGLEIDEIIIYNQLGQKVLRDNSKDQILDVSSLPSGLYVIGVVCGERRFIGKFIK